MGCASSAFLNPNDDDDFSQIGSSAFAHHIVNLTSTTYGLLTLDSPKPNPTTMPPPSFSGPEVINSWELMAGLDADSFRFTPPDSAPATTPFFPASKSRFGPDKENSDPNRTAHKDSSIETLKKDLFLLKEKSAGPKKQEETCLPDAEDKVVIYTTTLRGIRKTFEACNAVRSAIQGLGVMVCERDVSMDRGFREELRQLMNNGKKQTKEEAPISVTLPQVFVKGKHIGGAEEVLRLQEEGGLIELLDGLPRLPTGFVCDGCGGIRFLPCFTCNGSCKMVVHQQTRKRNVIVRCPDCNENGLVLCPICC